MMGIVIVLALAASCFLGAIAAIMTETDDGQKAKLFAVVSGIISILLFGLGFWLILAWR